MICATQWGIWSLDFSSELWTPQGSWLPSNVITQGHISKPCSASGTPSRHQVRWVLIRTPLLPPLLWGMNGLSWFSFSLLHRKVSCLLSEFPESAPFQWVHYNRPGTLRVILSCLPGEECPVFLSWPRSHSARAQWDLLRQFITDE